MAAYELRLTPNRRTVLAVLEESDRPLTVEEVVHGVEGGAEALARRSGARVHGFERPEDSRSASVSRADCLIASTPSSSSSSCPESSFGDCMVTIWSAMSWSS